MVGNNQSAERNKNIGVIPQSVFSLTLFTITTIVLGYFTFVLHTHLPYVLHHGKWPFGSDWLSEAVSECYIPILKSLNTLKASGLKVKISMDFSPILLEQLVDPNFPQIFIAYCDEKITLAEADFEEFGKIGESYLQPLATYWKNFYSETKRSFVHDHESDLITSFKKLADCGILDAMTCGATHGYFPLLLDDRNIRAQLQLAIATHEKYFGAKPRGIWLPECAYRPRYTWSPPAGDESIRSSSIERSGIEELLSEFGLEYFVVEGTLTKGGAAMGSYHELFSPIQDQLGHSEQWQKFLFHSAEKANRSLADIYGVKSTLRALPSKIPAVFSRDRDTSEQVWSGEKGYPGDSHYLEFHKKHHNSGLRYWKITGTKIDIGQKEQYDPKATEKIVSRHAEHFIQLVREGLKRHAAQAGSIGVVCSPFDTELFGHWWFEGPTFLEKVLKLLSHDSEIVLTNCSEAIDLLPQPRKIIALPEGSWGEGGGHYVWLNQDVAWTWDDIYKFEKQFLTILSDYRKERKPSKFLTKLLKQAARELLLVEASDWQFLITTKSASEYSTKRFKTHCKRLAKLLKIADRILNGKDKKDKDEKYLEKVSIDDRPFAEIDLGWWR